MRGRSVGPPLESSARMSPSSSGLIALLIDDGDTVRCAMRGLAGGCCCCCSAPPPPPPGEGEGEGGNATEIKPPGMGDARPGVGAMFSIEATMSSPSPSGSP